MNLERRAKDREEATFEIDAAALELLEARVHEIEKYLGIVDIDMAFFKEQKEEDLKKKTAMLDEFVSGVEDKVICTDALLQRFVKLESFLKHGEPFTTQCLDLRHKTDFVAENYESIEKLIKQLEVLKQKEQILSVDPLDDVQVRMQELQRLKLGHNRILLESEN
jgi:hypothetical protein